MPQAVVMAYPTLFLSCRLWHLHSVSTTYIRLVPELKRISAIRRAGR